MLDCRTTRRGSSRTVLGFRAVFDSIMAERDFGCALPDGDAVLVDGGERYAQEIRMLDVAAADERNVFGNAQTGVETAFMALTAN